MKRNILEAKVKYKLRSILSFSKIIPVIVLVHITTCGSSHIAFDCYVYDSKTVENVNVLDSETKKLKWMMSICTYVSVWFSQNFSPPEQRQNMPLLVWFNNMSTCALTNVVDVCVLGLKPVGNCTKMCISTRTKTKEASYNTMKKQRRTKA